MFAFKNRDQLILADNLKFEINSSIKKEKLLGKDNKIKIINGDELVDTSILGEQNVILKYNEKHEKTIKLTIIDTTKPNIEGKEIDLLKDVVVTDNSKEEIKATVEGEYDFNAVIFYKNYILN